MGGRTPPREDADMDLHDAAAAALAAFLPLAAIDGIYLHLWLYRLPERPESYGEHRLHTLGAIFFLMTLSGLFLWRTGGWLLWAAAAVVAVDLVVAIVDTFVETDSRASLGGLSRAEYMLHMVIMLLRGAATALALGAAPSEAWALASPSIRGPLPEFAAFVGWQAMPGAVLMTVAHVWLCTPHGRDTVSRARAFLAARSVAAA
jgi:hypothetical protein